MSKKIDDVKVDEIQISKDKHQKNLDINALKRLFSYLFVHKWQLALVFVCVIASAITQVIGISMMQPIIDNYILKSDISGLKTAVINMALVYLISTITTFIYTRLMIRIGERSIRNLRNDLFIKIQKMPINFFDTNQHGQIMSRFTNDTDILSQSLSSTLPTLIRSLLMFIGTIIVMVKLSLILTIVMFAGLVIMIFVLKNIVGRTGKLFNEAQKNVSILNGFDEEMLSGQKVIKVFNKEEDAIKEFDEKSENLRFTMAEAMINAGKLMPFLVNSINIMYAIIAIVGVIMAINGNLTIGVLATFLTNARQLQNPIANVSQQANAVFSAMAGASRIFEIIDMPIEKDSGYIELAHVKVDEDGNASPCSADRCYAWKWEEDGKTIYKELEGRIDFEHVDFSYNGKDKILKDVTFYANPGEKIAFVGSTGAGKTTITNVITRFYEIDSGSIKIDGIDIRNIKKDHLRKAFGMVLQDVNLFTETISENIRYGKLSASENEIKDAAKLAGADSFIHRLPETYQTEIYGDGSSLSDGQNQLISISRAAIADPPMLILDEATSSIDTSTEIKVTKAMDNLMEGSTSIVIAHRLSTIQNADVIMVMEDGRIIERGSHDQLIKEKGTYYGLYTGALELD
ncbi:ABC transporter ATP-binding protein [Anaerococcus sp. Marseille-P9784]|uniref:ABC transporter ATP-binding protein n=1 Tax=Anaerococcus sp. Marseille-P9784 TaxID=2614127 RepID=UPI00124A7112|nr:ABC transporter ATP-binding protein [Anaerococcus sp. Marseille-P9784]